MALLFERENELDQIDAALARAAAGLGTVIVIEGEAGIGKTELLAAARARASARGLAVLSARGSELEHDFAYGVVRQLFRQWLRSAPQSAGLAGPALSPHGETDLDGGSAPDQSAVLHGLYWLSTDIAAGQPLAIVIDDAHWADPASLRFAAFVSSRLEDTPIVMLLGVREHEAAADGELLLEIRGQPAAALSRPRPLSDEAVTQMAAEILTGDVDPEFARACRHATGGVPFLVRELLTALADDRVAPTAAATALVGRLSPESVGTSSMQRLGRLGEPVTRIARAVAVLGVHASAERAAKLADIPEPEAIEALDALVAARILQPGLPIDFVHPLVGTSVYDAIPPYLRSAMHTRAAALLTAAGADPEAIAAHLLLTERRENPEQTTVLVAAADQAIARAAPDSAVAYLRRALDAAPPHKPPAWLLFELGRCEQMVRDSAAIGHLRAALEAETDRRARARIALVLAGSLFYVADLAGSHAVLTSALENLTDADEDLAIQLMAVWAQAGYGDPRLHPRVVQALPRIREMAGSTGSGAPDLLTFLALVAVTQGEPSHAVLELVERGLGGRQLLDSASSDSTSVALSVDILVYIDELDRAREVSAAMLEDARRRGLVLGFVAASAHSGLAALRAGELELAEADVRAALDLAQQHQLLFTIPFTLTYLAQTLLERGAAAEALALIDRFPLPPGFEDALAGAMLRAIRGRLLIAVGDSASGVRELEAAGQALETIEIRNPNCENWRSDLALAIAGTDPARAAALVEEELRLARACGSARAEGISLRACGLLVRAPDSISLLREAVAALERSPARLEHARALVDLGAALRRANARAEARQPLRRGLELAARCGALALAQRARLELIASGGRPRRTVLSTHDVLTASEQRIAALAARGDTNRQIAQALFITPKTVENHLGRIYRKLDINKREQLADTLAAQDPVRDPGAPVV